MTNELNALLVPGNQHALRVAPDQIKPGNLQKKEELILLESGSWLRRRRDHKAMSDSSDEEYWMGSPPHMALLPR